MRQVVDVAVLRSTTMLEHVGFEEGMGAYCTLGSEEEGGRIAFGVEAGLGFVEVDFGMAVRVLESAWVSVLVPEVLQRQRRERSLLAFAIRL